MNRKLQASQILNGLDTKGFIIYYLKEYQKAIELFGALIDLGNTFSDGYYDRSKTCYALRLDYYDDLMKAIEYRCKECEEKAKKKENLSSLCSN